MKAKIVKFEENSKKKIFGKCINILLNSRRSIDLRIMYVIKKDDGTTAADTISILSRWEHFYCNLLNVNQSTGLNGRDPVVPDTSPLQVELAIENLKT
jgi:hypothetical protein